MGKAAFEKGIIDIQVKITKLILVVCALISLLFIFISLSNSQLDQAIPSIVSVIVFGGLFVLFQLDKIKANSIATFLTAFMLVVMPMSFLVQKGINASWIISFIITFGIQMFTHARKNFKYLIPLNVTVFTAVILIELFNPEDFALNPDNFTGLVTVSYTALIGLSGLYNMVLKRYERLAFLLDDQKSEIEQVNAELIGEKVKALQLNVDLEQKNKELKQEKEILYTTQEISKTGYWEYNLMTHDSIMSDIAKDIYGFSRDQKSKMSEAMDYYPEESVPIVEGAMDKLMKEGTPYDITVKFLQGKTKEIWVRTTGNIQYENDKPFKIYGLFQDVTEQKEKELLETEQKMLRMEADHKSTFLAQMSHEIRTPLNGIVGIIDLLEKEELDPKKKELLGTVLESSNDLVTIVSDVLNLSKLEAGKDSVNKSEFSLFDVLGQSVDLYKEKGMLKQVAVSSTWSKEIKKYLLSDRLKITQVANNFISNAVKYTNAGGTVEVSCQVKNNELLFEVKDSGRGIPEHELEKVFAKFEQTTETIRKKFEGTEEGTGLGLQICKLIVELLDGQLGVRSKIGVGSTFWFKIPVVEVEDLNKEETVQKLDGPVTLNKRVLLVDDKLVNLKVAGLMLHKLGCEVITAENGEIALNLIMNQERPFDIVFMDIQMPVMNGLVATFEIKRQLQDLAPPVIALTARNMEGDREEILGHGLDDFLPKPIKKDDLEMMIVKYTQVEV